MPSNYPSSLDNFTLTHTDEEPIGPDVIDLQDAVNNLEEVVGLKVLHTGSYSLTDVVAGQGNPLALADLSAVPEGRWTGRVRVGLWVDADPGASWNLGFWSPWSPTVYIRGTGDVGSGANNLVWVSAENVPAGLAVSTWDDADYDPRVLDEMASLKPARGSWNAWFSAEGGSVTVKKFTLEFMDEFAPDIAVARQMRLFQKTSADAASPALEVVTEGEVMSNGYTGIHPIAARLVGELLVMNPSHGDDPESPEYMLTIVDAAENGIGGYVQGKTTTGPQARYGGIAVEESVQWDEDFNAVPYGDRDAQAAFTALAITEVGGFNHVRTFVAYMSGRVKQVLLANVVGRTLLGAAGQTANLEEWKDSTDSLLAAVTSKGGFKFVAQAAAGVPNDTLFKDSADGKLKFKDGSGAVNALY